MSPRRVAFLTRGQAKQIADVIGSGLSWSWCAESEDDSDAVVKALDQAQDHLAQWYVGQVSLVWPEYDWPRLLAETGAKGHPHPDALARIEQSWRDALAEHDRWIETEVVGDLEPGTEARLRGLARKAARRERRRVKLVSP